MTSQWVERPVTLWFRFGERKVHAVTRPGLVLDDYFLDLPQDVVESTLPLERLGRDIGAILLPSHPASTQVPALSRNDEFIRYVPSSYRRFYIDLTGTYADYLKQFSGKTRSTLTRKLRKFAEFSGGEIHWKTYRTENELSEFHQIARDLSAKTYQERLLNSGLPATDDFKRSMNELASRDGVRAYLLYHDDKAIAYLYCPSEGAALLYAYLGYDPDFAQWSPGTVLQLLALESLFAEKKYRIFDFTQGEGAHKELFGTRSQLCADFYYFRASFYNRALLNLHRGTSALQKKVVAGLDRWGVKSRLKKILRRKG